MICQTHRFYNNRLLFIFFSIFVGFITVAGVLGATRNPVADFDGDGKSDISVYRPSNGFWYIAKSSGGYSFVSWGISTDMPVPGDYDGDGRTDFAVYRRGTWSIVQSSNNTIRTEYFGLANDVFVPGDYDGDQKADIAVWRPSNGYWYWISSLDKSFNSIQFGQSGDKPTPADYDGDGKTDVAVFRPSNGVWYLQHSSKGFRAEQFGLSGDVPVPNVFVRSLYSINFPGY